MIVISEDDSVIDAHRINIFFEDKFTNSDNILVWYGSKLDTKKPASTFTYPLQLDHLKISTGSHMGPLFSPDNPYYGKNGSHIIYRNSLDSDSTASCETGEPIWFSAWGYSEENKIFARLTWNPYFSELEKAMENITNSSVQDDKVVLN